MTCMFDNNNELWRTVVAPFSGQMYGGVPDIVPSVHITSPQHQQPANLGVVAVHGVVQWT